MRPRRAVPAMPAVAGLALAALAVTGFLAKPGLAHPESKPGGDPAEILFRGATIWTMGTEGVLEGADLLVRDGKIARIGRSIEAPEGALVVDLAGRHLTPGLIDAHSHTAIDGGVNEGSNNVTAEVRILDVLDPTDVAIYRELAGGLTAANVLHGSANSIGGQNAVIKLRWGGAAADLPLADAPPGIKFALGENPKRSNFQRPGEPQRYPATRMGVEASIRRAFLDALEYRREREAWSRLSGREKERREPPRRDLQMEALVEVLEGKRLVHAHCYRQDEILMLLRLAEEFGFRVATLQHVLEGYKVADEIAAHGAGASSFSDWWAYKLEAFDAIPHNGALMARRGVNVSFNSDSNELARRMNLEAAKAVKYGGLAEAEALALVTINPARQLGVERRIGSLEPGKDADLAVWSGHPLSTYTVCEQTWVDGRKLFDRAADRARRETVAAERAALIERAKGLDRPAPAAPPEPAPAVPAAPAAEPDLGSAAPPALYRMPPRPAGETIALVGATVHTVSGPEIPGGTVVVRDGRIAAVGASLAVPEGARVIRLDGLHLYPGLIDADTVLGLAEIGSVAGSVDVAETGSINPDARAEIAVNPDSEILPVTRAAGITHVLTAPRGGLVSGTSALIRLDGWTWEDLTASAPAAMHVQFPRWRAARAFGGASRSKDDLKRDREKAMADLSRAFAAARAYRRAKEADGRGARVPEKDPALEAMLPVVSGKLPVIVHAQEVRQIRAALAWAREEKIRILLAGAGDAWRLAPEIRAAGVPVILGPIHELPARRDEPYDTPFAAAGRLHEAGVTFCIASGGGQNDASNTRNLPYQAATAAAYGLPKAEALKAVTLYPARILGLEADLGSIEPGRSASLIVTDGDPLEIRTGVKHVFIDGREVDLMNRHRRLYERYAARPARNPSGR